MQRTYWDNGKLQSEYTDSMSVKNGLLKSYNEDGKLIKVVPYTSGVENGLAREYRADGTLITVTYYRNGYFQKEERINRVDKNGMKQGLYKDFTTPTSCCVKAPTRTTRKTASSKSTALTDVSSGKKNTAWANWW